LEGTLKIIWFQPLCHEQGHLPLDQVAQRLVQPGLEHCQGGGIHNFSRQPVALKSTLAKEVVGDSITAHAHLLQMLRTSCLAEHK